MIRRKYRLKAIIVNKKEELQLQTGLRLLIQIKKQERIKSLRGRLKWDGDLEKMRLDQ